MQPIANFIPTITELSVSFADSSLNSPTSWLWDFGDINSGSNSSTLQNPSHTFSLPGTYSVILTATNTDGSNSKTLVLSVRETVSILSISDMVDIKVPANITVDSDAKANYIKVEQLFLNPLLISPLSPEDIHDESKWDELANVLVAELVAYKLTTDEVNKLILALTGVASSSTSTTSVATGNLKRLVTGPSEAEFFSNAELITAFLKTSFKGGSIFQTTAINNICSLAKRLRIYHPLCERNRKTPILPNIIN